MIRRMLRRLFRRQQLSLSLRYPQYRIGNGTYGDLEVHSWGEASTLSIGSYCSIGGGVKVFLGGEHRTDWVTTYPFNVLWSCASHKTGHPKTKGDVKIGSDVWIGTEALVLSGVTIGDGAVIGARCVVASNVPPYAIVHGNPARVAKYRFSEAQIGRLLKVAWWEWTQPQIELAMDDLLGTDIDLFLSRAEQGKYRD